MYTPVTMTEMEEFLKADKGWTVNAPKGQEVSFDFKKNDFIIRVFTSIPSDGISRDCGKDAIRVSIIARVDDKDRGVKKFPRVTRQQNWRIHLKLRIMEAFNYISEIRICAICSAPMALRKAKTTKNEFYGCTRFPECNNTERT